MIKHLIFSFFIMSFAVCASAQSQGTIGPLLINVEINWLGLYNRPIGAKCEIRFISNHPKYKVLGRKFTFQQSDGTWVPAGSFFATSNQDLLAWLEKFKNTKTTVEIDNKSYAGDYLSIFLDENSSANTEVPLYGNGGLGRKVIGSPKEAEDFLEFMIAYCPDLHG